MATSRRKGGASDGGSDRRRDEPDDEPEYTTLRFYAADADDLRALAALKTEEYGRNIAEVFRRVCAPAIRAALNQVMKRRFE